MNVETKIARRARGIDIDRKTKVEREKKRETDK